MSKSGLSTWRLKDKREPRLSNYTTNLQITSFAITKSENEDRIISWTRIANLFSVRPPTPDLPDPSLFNFMTCGQVKLAGIYLYIANMFHNLNVPKPLTDLLPLRPAKYGDLSNATQHAVLEAVGVDNLNPGTLLRPAQATLHMGFTWAVTLAHDATTNIISKAFMNINAKRTMDSDHRSLKLLRKADAPCHLAAGLVLALAIIDDISLLFAN